MRRLLSIERTHGEPPGPDRTGGRRQRRASQPREEAGAGGFSPQPRFDSLGLGYCGESAAGRGPHAFREAGTGIDAAVSSDAAASAPAAIDRPSRGLTGTAVLALIAFYRSSLSPSIPSSCRFYPTCSAYAYQAVATFGVGQGLWLALRRILRCRPFGDYGCDPVPEGKTPHCEASNQGRTTETSEQRKPCARVEVAD